jgi:hypothetical protein
MNPDWDLESIKRDITRLYKAKRESSAEATKELKVVSSHSESSMESSMSSTNYMGQSYTKVSRSSSSRTDNGEGLFHSESHSSH